VGDPLPAGFLDRVERERSVGHDVPPAGLLDLLSGITNSSEAI
jgi:hypothetical protein